MIRRILKRTIQIIKEEIAWFKIRVDLRNKVARWAR